MKIKLHKIYFTRQFTSGSLKGLTHNDSISFPEVKSCVEWVRLFQVNNHDLNNSHKHFGPGGVSRSRQATFGNVRQIKEIIIMFRYQIVESKDQSIHPIGYIGGADNAYSIIINGMPRMSPRPLLDVLNLNCERYCKLWNGELGKWFDIMGV